MGCRWWGPGTIKSVCVRHGKIESHRLGTTRNRGYRRSEGVDETPQGRLDSRVNFGRKRFLKGTGRGVVLTK